MTVFIVLDDEGVKDGVGVDVPSSLDCGVCVVDAKSAKSAAQCFAGGGRLDGYDLMYGDECSLLVVNPRTLKTQRFVVSVPDVPYVVREVEGA